MKTLWRYGVLAVICLVIGIAVGYTGPDLPPGPYCGQNPNLCCTGREDRCSAPILGTLCYCDDFCNRTGDHDDCCPDFFLVCHGEQPPLNIQECLHNNRYVPNKGKVQENCNECVCNGEEMLCSRDACIVDQFLIDAVNNDYYSTWRAKRHDPFYGEKLSKGIKLKLGTLNPERSTYGMYPIKPIYDKSILPEFFNANNRWPNMMSSIKDQEWCGSSWAISIADVASDKFAISSNGKEMPKLSAQQLVSCNSRGQKSCSGGYLDRAWQYIRKTGLVTDNCMHYEGKDTRCNIPIRNMALSSSNCVSPNSPPKRKNRYTVSPPVKIGSESDIMYEISTSGPLQATMKVYQDFFSYSRGIYRKSPHVKNPEFGYQSVRIVGWGEENGTKYWVAANSWGTDWGENGYFKILKGVNECDIESFVISTTAFTVENKAGVMG